MTVADDEESPRVIASLVLVDFGTHFVHEFSGHASTGAECSHDWNEMVAFLSAALEGAQAQARKVELEERAERN